MYACNQYGSFEGEYILKTQSERARNFIEFIKVHRLTIYAKCLKF